ncbi:hypothetical protein KUTeg_007320 [Tegillarca granosa]|uniref:Transmembrane protein 181 n=1 Tax=Tegillarca granosa TaxID=220873 RepID=A0ABQ9FCX1_TEGGR|nr:hypothetical protein KUTeg_007320 [Tegillarca granosa]
MADNYTFAFSTPSWTTNVRGFLSQFSDIFSAFTNYIAPSYKHDRCERSVQMRLYALNKRQFVLVFVAFFICFGISILIGVAGPPIIETVTKNYSDSKVDFKMWLIAHITTDSKGGSRFEEPFTVSIRIVGIKGEDTSVIQADNPNLKTEVCDDLILLHLGFLDFTNYIITINFYGLQETKFKLKNIVFSSYNTSFTQIEIWIRFVFLVLTFLVTCVFAHSLRKFSIRDWSIEQRWMSLLLPLLLLYDDPLFPLTFLVDSWVPGMLDGVFQASFLCGLLLFWLCIYHGVRQTDRRFVKFYLPKLLIVGLVWISAVTLASWQEYNELQDPTYYYRLDTTNFMVFFFIVGGVYLLYLLYLLIRAYAELRSMPYFDLRLKFMTLLMLIVLSISIAITVMRFGAAALQDNFVAELSTNYKNSADNFKDNPALSMLNDSDEEVHYGSDQEEMTLTNTGRPVNRYHDSDEETRRPVKRYLKL